MKVLNIVIAITILTITIFSCNKSTDGNTPTPPGNATAGSFTWKENGIAFTADSAHYSLCCSPTVTTIFAFKGTGSTGRFFEININGT